MVGSVVLSSAAVAAGAAAWAVRGRSSAVFGPSVWRGSGSRRALALTFDDGPSESTPALLECLDRFRAQATFFMCGMHVRRLPAVTREVAASGHELGNHTYSHARLWLRSAAFIHDETARAQTALAEAAGAEPRLFRAPYGVRWPGLRRVQNEFGLLGVMWTVIGNDWEHSASEVVSRVTRAAQNGAIVCLHDGRERQTKPDIRVTIDAVKQILPRLSDAGFRLVTVSDLIRTDCIG